jgi:radical SAM superfamily enzyme YgiQ (UPF0313 family)
MPRIRKIVMVEPRAPGYHVYSRVRLPRLGLPLLAGVLKQEGYDDVTLYCEDIAPIDVADVCRADLVGISTTTSTAPAAYRLGNLVKKRNPNATVVIGGVHVTFLPNEPFEEETRQRFGIDGPICDHVVRGEAERLLPALVRSIEAGDRPEPILGETLRPDPEHRIDWRRAIPNLDDLPLADVTAIVGHRRIHIAPIATSRGCPFDCSFCSVIEMFGQKMRYRSIEPDDPRSVISELRQHQSIGWRDTFFYDDNFCANVARTKQLLENMIRANVVPRTWSAQVRATEVVRDRELLELMRRTNCIMVYIGMESVNPHTLEEFNKRQTVEQIVEAIHVLQQYGIRAHGMFVFGADEDTVETLRATADFAIRHNVSTVQFMILTPLPGTRYFRKLRDEGRIFDYNWTHYDAHHTVFYPKRMSPAELQHAAFEGMSKVYRYSRCALAALQGNWMTAFFRLYGHNLIARHVRTTRDYVRGLPTQTLATVPAGAGS